MTPRLLLKLNGLQIKSNDRASFSAPDFSQQQLAWLIIKKKKNLGTTVEAVIQDCEVRSVTLLPLYDSTKGQPSRNVDEQMNKNK